MWTETFELHAASENMNSDLNATFFKVPFAGHYQHPLFHFGSIQTEHWKSACISNTIYRLLSVFFGNTGSQL